MTNLDHGIIAEAEAARYLKTLGYNILEQNWKTKWCEIDIVTQKDQTIIFVEVKYRLNDRYGTGLDYITPAKLKQMTRAAQGWVQENNWKGDYTLAAVEVTGDDYQITNFLDDIY